MPFLAELRIFSGTVLPPGFAFCDGTQLPIQGNEDLFAAIGNVYGQAAFFRLPDMRSRTFLHLAAELFSAGIGITGGQEQVTLGELPAHNHPAGCNNSATNSSVPAGNLLAAGPGIYLSGSGPTNSGLANSTVAVTGGGQPHNNLSPYLTVNFIICIAGGMPPVAGTPSGGAFSHLGGMLQLVAFPNIVMAGYARTDGTDFLRSLFTGLFSLIGTTFGAGNGSTTATLPNLLGKTVNGAGTGSYSGASTYAVGAQTGEAAHGVTLGELPSHLHDFLAVSDAADNPTPGAISLAASASFQTGVTGASMALGMIGVVGTGPPASYPTHENRPPFQGVTVLMAVDDVNPDLYTSEMIIGPWTSAPTGTFLCDGAAKTIAAEPDLFSQIGYTYGHGSGTDFLLPDARGRILVGAGTGNGLSHYSPGQTGGVESVTLAVTEIPRHSHPVVVYSAQTVAGQTTTPSGNILTVGASAFNAYKSGGTPVALNADAIRAAGGGAAHENRPPQVAFNMFIKR